MALCPVSLYCKVADANTDGIRNSLSENVPLPEEVRIKACEIITSDVVSMVEKLRVSKCDFLKLKEKLYRFNNKEYSRYKDNYLDLFTLNLTVNVFGQS